MKIPSKLRLFLTETTIYSGFNLVNKAIPFILLPILIRLISAEQYGYYSIFLTLESLLIPVIGLNMYSALSVHYYSEDFQLKDYMFTIFSSVITLIIVLCFLLYFIPENIVQYSGVKKNILIYGVVCAGFSTLFITVSSLFRLRRKPWLYGKYNLLQSFFLIALLVALAYYYPNYEILIIGKVMLSALFLVTSIIILRRLNALSWAFSKKLLKQILIFSLPTVIYSVSAFVFISSDKFLINYFLGATEVGYYTAIYQLASIVSILGVSINAAWMPWLFENLKENNALTDVFIVKLSAKLIIFLLLIGLIACAVFPFFSAIILPNEYQQNISVAYPLIMGFVFEGIYLIISPYVFYAGKTKYNAFIGIGIAVMNVTLNWLLIPIAGVHGAAYIFLLSWILLASAFFYFSNKVYPMPWKKIFLP